MTLETLISRASRYQQPNVSCRIPFAFAYLTAIEYGLAYVHYEYCSADISQGRALSQYLILIVF